MLMSDSFRRVYVLAHASHYHRDVRIIDNITAAVLSGSQNDGT